MLTKTPFRYDGASRILRKGSFAALMNKRMLPDDPSSGHRVHCDVDRHAGLLALGGVCAGAILEGDTWAHGAQWAQNTWKSEVLSHPTHWD